VSMTNLGSRMVEMGENGVKNRSQPLELMSFSDGAETIEMLEKVTHWARTGCTKGNTSTGWYLHPKKTLGPRGFKLAAADDKHILRNLYEGAIVTTTIHAGWSRPRSEYKAYTGDTNLFGPN